MKEHAVYLKKLQACHGAIKWANDYPTLQQAWNVCERGDQMLWLLGKQSGSPESESRKKLLLTVCKCARVSLKYIKSIQTLKSIQIAEKYAKGIKGVTLKDVINIATPAIAYVADATDPAVGAYVVAPQKFLKECAEIVRDDYPKIKMI